MNRNILFVTIHMIGNKNKLENKELEKEKCKNIEKKIKRLKFDSKIDMINTISNKEEVKYNAKNSLV